MQSRNRQVKVVQVLPVLPEVILRVKKSELQGLFWVISNHKLTGPTVLGNTGSAIQFPKINIIYLVINTVEIRSL